MKKLFFVLLSGVIFQFGYAQPYIPFGYDSLDINNWNVRFSACNSYFWDLESGYAKAKIPNNSNKTSLFYGNLWMGGLDSLDSLHVSADNYYHDDYICFTPGPYADTYDSAFYDKYNRVWKINKSEIEYHINHWNDAGYTMPEVIRTWPGNGNLTNGEAPVLAPYVDANGNSIYDPQNGDYPKILGDQAIYFILNDKAHINPKLGLPVGVELHIMAYAFQDTGVINNTFFTHFDIINRTQTSYHDFYVGIFNSIDIGYADDDYIGCDTTQSLFFGYNGDNEDGDGSSYTYGTHPPAVGVVLLQPQMEHFMYFLNQSGPIGNPSLGIEYYNYLQSRWKDGSHLVHHGTGHSPDDSDYCDFMFPKYSGWTEETVGNLPGDRRGVGSSYIGNFDSCLTFDVAYVWARDTNGDAYASLEKMLSQIPNVKSFFNQLNTDCSYLNIYNGLNTAHHNIDYFNMFPNPASHTVTFRTNLKNYTISVYSQLGQKLLERQNIKQLDIHNFSSGIYLVNITSGNKTEWRKLMVK